MTPRQLALALGPYTSFAVKDRFRRLMQGARSIDLRYDEVTDWPEIIKLIDREDEIDLFDGEEWFRLELVGSDG